MSTAIELAAREWLGKSRDEREKELKQLRVRAAALKFVGAFASVDAQRSEKASRMSRERLQRRYDR